MIYTKSTEDTVLIITMYAPTSPPGAWQPALNPRSTRPGGSRNISDLGSTGDSRPPHRWLIDGYCMVIIWINMVNI